MPWRNKSPLFSLCIWGGTLSLLWQIKILPQSILFFSVQSLKVHQKGESKAFSSLAWSWAQHWTCKWPSIFPGICWEVFKARYGLFMCHIFLIHFLTCSCNFKQLLLIVFDKHPGDRVFLPEWDESVQIKTSCVNETFPGNDQTMTIWR